MLRIVALLRRARRIPPAEWLGLLSAFVGLAYVDLLLRFAGFQRTAGLAKGFHENRPEARRSCDSADWQRARRYTRWIDTAARYHVVTARCLHRSLLLYRWLVGDALPADLRIGVRLQERRFQAHAWVEIGGIVVNDSPASIAEFAPLTGSGLAAASLSTASDRLVGARWSA